MNILFFLKPKQETAYISETHSLRQALEVMERYRYSSIPVISKTGAYIGSIAEGDILWWIKKNAEFDIKSAEAISIMSIARSTAYKAVSAESSMESLIGRAMDQNFVPVVDDQEKFIGIITRKSIIEYCYDKLSDCHK